MVADRRVMFFGFACEIVGVQPTKIVLKSAFFQSAFVADGKDLVDLIHLLLCLTEVCIIERGCC